MKELNYIDETIERNENPVLRISAVHSALSTVYLMDCIEGMRQFPDKFFDLAVVDPPYGISADIKNNTDKKQIIFGANYFGLVGGMLYWHKDVTMPTYSTGELAWLSWLQKIDFVNITWHGMLQHNMKDKEQRIHPTQKPVALYDWIFDKYASEGNLILDTHLGSQSSRIAANKAGLDFVGFEIDREYYDNGNKRFENFVSQGVLF